MSNFDPAAATAGYLSALTPEQHARATAYTQGGHWLLLWSALIGLAISYLILRSGVLVRVRDAVQAKGSKPWRAALAVLFVGSLIEMVLGLPWTVYSDWAREKAYGLTSRPFGGWLGEYVLLTAISLMITLPLLALLYSLIRARPKSWWLWGAGAFSAVMLVLQVLAPVTIMPLINQYKPAPPGPVRDMVVAMAKANGVPSDKIFIYDGSKQSNRYTANVAGLFGTARVAMSDVMFKKDADLAEVRGVVGHEMGHYVHRHGLWLSAGFGGLALVTLFLIDRLFPLAVTLTRARGVGSLSDPAGYPVVSMLVTVLALLGTPLTSSLTRLAESDADTFSLTRFNEPDGLAKALAKTIEYRAATPSQLEEVIFYDHPAVGHRIRKAMDWKASHPKP